MTTEAEIAAVIEVVRPLEIPLPVDTPLFTMSVILDGQSYNLQLDYCEREFRWYLSILTIDGIRLASGIKVIADWPLLRQAVDERLPPGILMSADVSGSGGESPEFADLGRRVKLWYYPKGSFGT